jgi:hypothetical protein
MTEEELEKRSWELFGEWVKENPEFPYGTDDMIAFASFILEKPEFKVQPNVILNIGKAKIEFDKPEIGLHDILGLYEDLENYLRSMHGVYL